MVQVRTAKFQPLFSLSALFFNYSKYYNKTLYTFLNTFLQSISTWQHLPRTHWSSGLVAVLKKKNEAVNEEVGGLLDGFNMDSLFKFLVELI